MKSLTFIEIDVPSFVPQTPEAVGRAAVVRLHVRHERRARRRQCQLERGGRTPPAARQDAQAGIPGSAPAEMLSARVGRAVVDGEHLQANAALRQHVVESGAQIPSRIADGKEHAHLGRVAQGFRARA